MRGGDCVRNGMRGGDCEERDARRGLWGVGCWEGDDQAGE